MSLRTVQRFYARFEASGEAGVATNYVHCGKNQAGQTAAAVLEKAQQLKNDHPSWGAELICLLVNTDEKVPVARTLQRWFKKKRLPTAASGRKAIVNCERATHPHEGWQMDAKEYIALKTGRRVSWLRVVDEFSGTVLGTTVFDVPRFTHVKAKEVRRELRCLFSRWGRPKRLRVDNGYPWGSTGDFPTDLALWLIGTGIEMVWNPPCQPQKNGVVERSQGVGKNWAEPAECRSPMALQKRLNKMDRIQREVYPYCGKKSRMMAYPGLKSSRRKFDRNWEKRNWRLQRVLDHLSEYLVERRVDRSGTVSIYNRNYYVGKHHATKVIHVYFDPVDVAWVFSGSAGEQLRVQPADQITQQRIMRLDVTNRRIKPK